jgi:hypothetical protein
MTCTDSANAALDQKGEQDSGADESQEEEESSDCDSHCKSLYCVDTTTLPASKCVQVQ